jgi:hypothetical protein
MPWYIDPNENSLSFSLKSIKGVSDELIYPNKLPVSISEGRGGLYFENA